MRVYFAALSKTAFVGSLPQCINWANEQIDSRKARTVKILKARPNELKARIIFEVTKDGTRATRNGRVINLALLKSVSKHGQET